MAGSRDLRANLIEDILSNVQSMESLIDRIRRDCETLRLTDAEEPEVSPQEAAVEPEVSPQDAAVELEVSPQDEPDYFMLSDVAIIAIENSQGPLQPELLKEFLIEVFHKHKVLSIVRNYTEDVEGLISQLEYVRDEIKRKDQTKKQRNLDFNFERRIDRMIENIRRELEEEADETRRRLDKHVPRNE